MSVELLSTELSSLICYLNNKKYSIITRAFCAIQLLPRPTARVFVDHPTKPLFVLFVPFESIATRYGRLSYHLYIDDDGDDSQVDDVALAEFLDSFQLSDKSKSLEFAAVNVSVFSTLKRYFESRSIKFENTEKHCNVYAYDQTVSIDIPKLEDGFIIDKVKAEELEETNQCWKYSNEFTKALLKHAIEEYPCIGIRDMKNGGKLASFIFATSFGMQNHLFTYAQYRHKGFAKTVTITHAKLIQSIFGSAISTVVHTNRASNNMFTKMKYKLIDGHQVIWTGTQELATSQVNPDVVKQFGINY